MARVLSCCSMRTRTCRSRAAQPKRKELVAEWIGKVIRREAATAIHVKDRVIALFRMVILLIGNFGALVRTPFLGVGPCRFQQEGSALSGIDRLVPLHGRMVDRPRSEIQGQRL